MKRILSTSILCLAIGFTSACGGSDDTPSTTKTSTTDQQSDQSSAGRGPTGSGEVVDVSDSTAQVKGQESQVAVSWTDSTTFTRQVSGSADDVKVGSCVMVTAADASSSSTDTVAAGSVRITEATDGSCSMGGGGAPGAPQGGDAPQGGTRPEGTPPDGERPGKGTAPRGGFAVGEVTAVTDAGFTVTSQRPGADDESTVEVTISDDTTYTKTAEAAATDIKVGVCVTSRGKADDTGAITAETIAIAAKVDGECSMGGFRGGRPGSGQPGDAADAPDAAPADAA